MSLTKTDAARTALLHHHGNLSMAERRALILCDGKRSHADVVGLLGPGALPALDRLLRDGYLLRADTPVVRAVASPPAREQRTLPAVVAETPQPMRPAPPSRRSLAATKMYLVDMLQLQRDAESASLKAALQTSPSEDELVYRLLKALQHIQSVANASYAQRVAERVAEILPEAHLPRLPALHAGPHAPEPCAPESAVA